MSPLKILSIDVGYCNLAYTLVSVNISQLIPLLDIENPNKMYQHITQQYNDNINRKLKRQTLPISYNSLQHITIQDWNIVNIYREYCTNNSHVNNNTSDTNTIVNNQLEYEFQKTLLFMSLQEILGTNGSKVNKGELYELMQYWIPPNTTLSSSSPYHNKMKKLDLFNYFNTWIETELSKLYYSKYLDENELKISLVQHYLRKRFHNEEIDVVIIENQPSLLNSPMKTIQNAIHNYFAIKRNECNLPFIYLVGANQKNSIFNKLQLPSNMLTNQTDMNHTSIHEVEEKIIELKKKKRKKENTHADDVEQYKCTKNISVLQIQCLLENNLLNFMDNNWQTIFHESDKQDDLSDCMLQCLHFIYHII